LISHSQIAYGFSSFSIAKATHEDVSYPNANIGRVPKARNREQLVYKDMWFSCTCVRWREEKWAYKIDGFVEPSPSALKKRYLDVFEYHLFYDEFDPKSTYGSS